VVNETKKLGHKSKNSSWKSLYFWYFTQNQFFISVSSTSLVAFVTCLKQTWMPSLPLQPLHQKDNPLQHISCPELVHCTSRLQGKALLDFLMSVWLLHSEPHTVSVQENWHFVLSGTQQLTELPFFMPCFLWHPLYRTHTGNYMFTSYWSLNIKHFPSNWHIYSFPQSL
jgi:hypothetical protein